MHSNTSLEQTSSKRKWKTSCWTLYDAPGLLLSSILFPCGAYYKAAASFENEPADWCESACGGVCCFCGFDLRSRFREKYKLRGNECQDFCMHCWCNSCGLAQIQREAELWQKETTSSQAAERPQGHQHRESELPLKINTDSPAILQPVSPQTMQNGQNIHGQPSLSEGGVPMRRFGTRGPPVGVTVVASQLSDLIETDTDKLYEDYELKIREDEERRSVRSQKTAGSLSTTKLSETGHAKSADD